MKRILVTGSRDWENEVVIALELGRALGEMVKQGVRTQDVVLVHGDCPTGADAIADKLWRSYGLEVVPRPALWNVWGKKAGPLRNAHMVNDIGADLCLAFIGPGSRGAAGCARLAEKAEIETRRFPG